MQNRHPSLLRDAAIVFLSLIVALLIVRSGLVHEVLAATQDLGVITSFIAGAFFASVFTAVPAGVVLGELSQEMSPWVVALVGGLGCFLSDLVIASFLKRRVANDLDGVLRQSPLKRIYRSLQKNAFFRWLSVLLGALVIVSPFPDEIGLLLMGASHLPKKIFYPLLFILDVIGILLITLLVRAI